MPDQIDRRDRPRVTHEPSARSRRILYLRANHYEALIALSAVVSGIVFFAVPGLLADTTLGRAAGPYDQLWSVLYILAGIFTLSGLTLGVDTARFGPLTMNGLTLEYVGLLALAAGVSANIVAAWSIAGFSAPIALLVAVVLATLQRASTVLKTVKSAVVVRDA